MTIAIIGAGNVGGTLGHRWKNAGHEVIFASRNPDAKQETVSFQEAAKRGDFLLLAIRSHNHGCSSPWRCCGSGSPISRVWAAKSHLR